MTFPVVQLRVACAEIVVAFALCWCFHFFQKAMKPAVVLIPIFKS